jgi:Flp pilus assembly protein TadG
MAAGVVRENAVVVRLPARLRSETGAELVEFALVLPIVLLVFGGIVDFGLLLQRQQVVTNAAREGARLAVLPGYTTTDVQSRVTQFVREGINSTAAAPSTTVTMVTLTPGTGPAFQAARVQVTLADSFLILGPIVSLAGGTGSFGTIALTATTTMRIETVASGS